MVAILRCGGKEESCGESARSERADAAYRPRVRAAAVGSSIGTPSRVSSDGALCFH
jgi:hypothetical protein